MTECNGVPSQLQPLGRRDVVAAHPMTLFVLGLRYFYDSGDSGGDDMNDSGVGSDMSSSDSSGM